MALTVLLPVIRRWTMEQVCAGIAASDIPREHVILVLDAPGCEDWIEAMFDLGFTRVTTHVTGNPYPSEDRLERRPRWRAMRRLTQTLVGDGPLLCVEDDVIVPPDVYARLTAAGAHATAAIRARWCPLPVVYGTQSWGTGVEPIKGCGYNCLLTTGEAYRAATLSDDDPGPADYEHTSQLPGLVVDWDCICGHITESEVLWP